MRRTNLTFVWIVVCAAAVGGVGRFASAQDVLPFPILQIQTSGMVGIAAGQTARLNALNPGVPAPLATGARCSAQLSFVDDQGSVLKMSSVTVDPGKSMSLDLNRDKEVASTATRVQIRAVVSMPLASGSGMPPIVQPLPFCTIVPTLEIIDNLSFKTQVILSESRFISLPIPLDGDGGQNSARR